MSVTTWGAGKMLTMSTLAVEAARFRDHATARPLSEWHEDLGQVLWWRFPVVEAPYVGSPLDDGWTDNYYTHWTRFEIPEAPRDDGQKGGER